MTGLPMPMFVCPQSQLRFYKVRVTFRSYSISMLPGQPHKIRGLLHPMRRSKNFLAKMTFLRFIACFLFGALFAVPYVRFVITDRSPGRSRALVSLPICIAFVSAPLLFNMHDEILERVVIMFVFSWLATFKVMSITCHAMP
jgi:hypothetical protein